MAESKSDQTRRAFLVTAGAGLLAAAAPATQLAPPDKQPPNLKIPKPQPKKCGFAIVGLGQLALGEVMGAFRETKYCKPVALVSGHAEKAKQVAETYGVDPKAIYNYENFDSIKDNDEIDVVYIILPNSMHAEYTIRALKAGKHVLCEKPMATSVDECEKMIAAAKEADRKLMIAYRLRYEPFNMTAIDLLRKKTFGELRMIESTNTQNVRAPNIRLSKKLGGGPLGDVGIYTLNACRYLTGEEPTEVTGRIYQPTDDPRFAEVPRDVLYTLQFPSGVTAHCGCSFGAAESRRYRVMCDKGWLEMDPAFPYRGLQLATYQDQKKTTYTLQQVNHFSVEMDHIAECIEKNEPVRTPGEEGMQDMKIIHAILQSAQEGKSIKIR